MKHTEAEKQLGVVNGWLSPARKKSKRGHRLHYWVERAKGGKSVTLCGLIGMELTANLVLIAEARRPCNRCERAWEKAFLGGDVRKVQP